MQDPCHARRQVHGETLNILARYWLGRPSAVLRVNQQIMPKTLIFNRGLTSIQKASNQLYPFPISFLLYQSVYFLGLDANPERELTHFFQRLQSHGSSLENRKVVIIEARNDRYFSGAGKLDPSFYSTLSQTGVDIKNGTFFVPIVAEAAHHALRLDWILNNHEAGSVTANFLPMRTNESLAEGLVNGIFRENSDDKFHTCFIFGGNKDSLDSITYMQAAPLLSAFIKDGS